MFYIYCPSYLLIDRSHVAGLRLLVVFVDVGHKGIFLIFSVFCAALLAGCATTSAGGNDVTALASSLPQVKTLLVQYPDAKISVALWNRASVEKNIDSIRADCGAQFEVADYYKVSVADPSLSLVVWLDKSGQNVMCAVKGATNNTAAAPTGVPVKPQTSTTVPPASSTSVPSEMESMPTLPPDESVVSTSVPPMPAEPQLTAEEEECVKGGATWNTCASPCEGSNDSACIQSCIARCEYGNKTYVPMPAPSFTPVTAVNCTDTDGTNINTQGHVTVRLSDGTGYTSYDYCADSKVLVERACYKNNVLDMAGECLGYCSNGACVNSTLYASPTPGVPVVVSTCVYITFNGTCKISGLNDTDVRFWFAPLDAAQVASQAFLKPNFNEEKSENLSYFMEFSTQGTTLAANNTYSCEVSIKTRGTCAPLIYRLS